MNPKFPVIWFGDKCGVMHFENEQDLSTTELMLWGPLTFEYGTIIDIKGKQFKLSIREKEKISFGKIIKVLFGKQVKAKVYYNYQSSSMYDLENLKNKLIKFSDNDPGDLMWQFIDHKDIVKGVKLSQNNRELFEFVGNNICADGQA